MFISRESCANGFKRWSDSQQQKYRERTEDNGVVMPGPDLGRSRLTAPGGPQRTPLLPAKGSL